MAMRVLVLAALAAVALFLPRVAGAETVSGRAVVTDGDTLRIGTETVRLFGIDAPEARQTCQTAGGKTWRCGRWSTATLQRLASGRLVCTGDSRDRYGRLLARCGSTDGDIGRAMVAAGAAQAYRRYSTDYVDAEKAALFAGLGIWQGLFQSPEDYRAATAQSAGTQATDSGGCAIKGNISASGRIYHLPGQEDYDATRISPSRGERWFCTEEQARAAGWRRARR